MNKTPKDYKIFIHNLLTRLSCLKPAYIDIICSDENITNVWIPKTFTTEAYDPKNNYETFEQIGDVIVNQFIVTYLYKKYPFLLEHVKSVDIVSKLKDKYGKKQSLYERAIEIGLHDFVRMTKDQTITEEENMKKPPKERGKCINDIYEDVFEAFFGTLNYFIDNITKQPGLGSSTSLIILENIFRHIVMGMKYFDLYDKKGYLKDLMDANWINVKNTKMQITKMAPGNKFVSEIVMKDVNPFFLRILNDNRDEAERLAVEKALEYIRTKKTGDGSLLYKQLEKSNFYNEMDIKRQEIDECFKKIDGSFSIFRL